MYEEKCEICGDEIEVKKSNECRKCKTIVCNKCIFDGICTDCMEDEQEEQYSTKFGKYDY